MILIMQGLPASGKSTFAKAWVEELPKSRIRVNRDDIRRMLGPYWLLSREHLVTDIEHSAIRHALEEDYDVVIDNMNLGMSYINDYLSIAHQFDTTVEYKSFLDVPVEVCIERDKNRVDSVGEETIRKVYIKYAYLFEDTDVR